MLYARLAADHAGRGTGAGSGARCGQNRRFAGARDAGDALRGAGRADAGRRCAALPRGAVELRDAASTCGAPGAAALGCGCQARRRRRHRAAARAQFSGRGARSSQGRRRVSRPRSIVSGRADSLHRRRCRRTRHNYQPCTCGALCRQRCPASLRSRIYRRGQRNGRTRCCRPKRSRLCAVHLRFDRTPQGGWHRASQSNQPDFLGPLDRVRRRAPRAAVLHLAQFRSIGFRDVRSARFRRLRRPSGEPADPAIRAAA